MTYAAAAPNLATVRRVGDVQHGVEATVEPANAYRFTGFNRFLDQEGHPAVQPPWGSLTAIDLNAGTTRLSA